MADAVPSLHVAIKTNSVELVGQALEMSPNVAAPRSVTGVWEGKMQLHLIVPPP